MQICRHPDPRNPYPVVEVTNGETTDRVIIDLRELIKDGEITPTRARAIKVNSVINWRGTRHKVVDVLHKQCSMLDPETNACNLRDPKACSGCKVVDNYSNMEEVQSLASIGANLVYTPTVNRIIENSDKTLASLHERFHEAIEAGLDLSMRYSPINNFTMDYLKRNYPEQLKNDTLEFTDTGAVYEILVDETTGEVVREKLGVLKYSWEDRAGLRRDLIAISALIPLLGEYSALTMSVKQETETEGKKIRAAARLEAERLINSRIVQLKRTDEVIESLLRNSKAYAAVKEQEIKAEKLNRTVWNLSSGLADLMQTIKHEIKSLELELTTHVAYD